MSTIYNDLQNDFTQIPNTILTDTKISALAFKIYCYICYRIGVSSQWEFYNDEIISHFKEKTTAFFRAKNELLKYGYLKKIKQNKAINGKFKGCDYSIHKNPISPTPIFPITAEPKTAEPKTVKGVTNNIEENNIDPNKYIKECNAVNSNFPNLAPPTSNAPLPPVGAGASSGAEEQPKVELPYERQFTYDIFKEEWNLLSFHKPKRGWDDAERIFRESWKKMSPSKKKALNNSWTAYLKEWVAKEYPTQTEYSKKQLNDDMITFNNPSSAPLTDEIESVKDKLNEEYLKLNNDFQNHLKNDFTSDVINYALSKITIMRLSVIDGGAIKPVLHFGNDKIKFNVHYFHSNRFEKSIRTFLNGIGKRITPQSDWFSS